jgi:5-formyltetrahydrofolate cyclo-ligase
MPAMRQDRPAERTDPRDAKRLMRERILRARDALPPESRLRFGNAIVAALAEREDFRHARTALLSLAFRSEWETRPLLAAALALGKTVVVPRVDRPSRMLELHAISDLGRDIAPGYLGIDEPLPHCASVEPTAIDWVLVPGVAFDLSGHRIGYGGGYYDRLLPSLRRDAPRIAGAFELQIVERIQAAPHDVRIDAIVTEARTIVPGAD